MSATPDPVVTVRRKTLLAVVAVLLVLALGGWAIAAAIPTSGVERHGPARVTDGRGHPGKDAKAAKDRVRAQRLAVAKSTFVPQYRERFPDRATGERAETRAALTAVRVCEGLDRDAKREARIDRRTPSEAHRAQGRDARPARTGVTGLAVATVCPEHKDRTAR